MQVGDKVNLGGKTVKIIARHAAGKHVHFTLEDGSVVTDLHKDMNAKIVTTKPLNIKYDIVPPDVVNGEDWND
jgi:hypothetical protein